jgi:uracil-DNA glycosylase family protein
VPTVRLASASDFEGFRRACRALWAAQVEPGQVDWRIASAGASGPSDVTVDVPPPSSAAPLHVPARFVPLCQSAILHRSPARFALLYRLLWRLQVEPPLRHDPCDADWQALEAMASAAQSGACHDAGMATAAPRPSPAPASLPELADALQRCRECPIGAQATRAVPGEGPAHARLMFVGEQPGDQEDLHGRPFVGPAGQLFSRALGQLGIDRREVYVTNAVKHFKFELRGQRRIHKTPAQQEAAACLHWLESEIDLVDPGALVALGATAARQLMGATIAVTRQRGQWLKRGDGRRVLITLHPSALLRMEPEEKEAAYAAWLQDLRQAADAAPP